MKIRSINNTNFQGLWKITLEKTNKTAKENSRELPIYKRSAVLRPFSDESEFEIIGQLNRAKRARVYKHITHSRHIENSMEDCYIINNVSLGETLNITSKDYEEVLGLEERGTPSMPDFVAFDNFIPKRAGAYPDEIRKMLD